MIVQMSKTLTSTFKICQLLKIFTIDSACMWFISPWCPVKLDIFFVAKNKTTI